MSETIREGLQATKNTEARTMFEMLRRYVESRLEMNIKVSKFLP